MSVLTPFVLTRQCIDCPLELCSLDASNKCASLLDFLTKQLAFTPVVGTALLAAVCSTGTQKHSTVYSDYNKSKSTTLKSRRS